MDGGIQEAVAASFHDGIYKCILSNPVSKAEGYRKIVLNRLQGYFQLEKYTEKQVFHEKLTQDQAQSFLCNALQEHFRQYNGWDTSREYQIRISAKGRVLCSRKAIPNQAPRAVQFSTGRLAYRSISMDECNRRHSQYLQAILSVASMYCCHLYRRFDESLHQSA